jgi:methionine-rich copper-binding protein CopC
MRAPHSPRPSIRPVVAVGIAVLAVLLIAPVAVLAHAELATATPADKSTVSGSPAEIVMTFTEPLAPANSSLKLVDAANNVIVEGSTVDPADARTMHLPIPATLAPGTYTVRWTTKSAIDGDLDHGTTTFTVAAATSSEPSSSGGAVSSIAPASVPAAATSSAATPSAAPATPATSTGDAVIPVVVALIVLAGLGLWLIRGRSRRAR